MNALELAQRFANAVGTPGPSVLYGSSNDDDLQILELLNQEGRSLSTRHDWKALMQEASWTSVATESQGTVASIIGATQSLRRIVNETIWNRSTREPVYGPENPQAWQARKALTYIGPWPHYRIRGGELLLNPVPTAGESYYFEYVSNCWCTNAAGSTYRRNIAADDDVFLLDDEIMLAGLEWRWLRKKGLSYAEEFASYEALVAAAIAADGTRRALPMDSCTRGFQPGVMVPSGGWPL